MKLFATDYEILRNIAVDSRLHRGVQLPRKPIRVGYLMDEALFHQAGGLLEHDKTVFLDERLHDWDWQDGVFTYYSHALESDVMLAASGQPREPFAVLVVYAEERR
jgi:hypothetical protein